MGSPCRHGSPSTATPWGRPCLHGAWAAETAAETASVEDARDLLWGTLYGLACIASVEDIGFDRALRLADQGGDGAARLWSASTADPEGRPQIVKGEK
ncbi:hypothetical protein [Streptomyces sp. NPDC051662]|uniref:hypothetical protein n=1 Tax=Streptomyces sp. NPDC051662 TaxID=3154750 RepID=UPI00342C5C4F